MQFLEDMPKYYKAVAAFVSLLVPFLTILGTSLSDGTVTGSEWTAIVTAGVAVTGGTKAVYQIRNQK